STKSVLGSSRGRGANGAGVEQTSRRTRQKSSPLAPSVSRQQSRVVARSEPRHEVSKGSIIQSRRRLIVKVALPRTTVKKETGRGGELARVRAPRVSEGFGHDPSLTLLALRILAPLALDPVDEVEPSHVVRHPVVAGATIDPVASAAAVDRVVAVPPV